MAFQNGNKFIVTDGLVYALDFGNQKTYISGSSHAYPLNFRLAETSSVFQPFTLDNNALQYEPPTAFNTYYRYISTTGSIFNFNTNAEFTLIFTVKAATNGSLLLDNTNDQSLAINLKTSSLDLGYYNPNTETYYTRTYPFSTNTAFQHIVCRYSKGTFDLYLNSLPLSASSQGIVLETLQTSSYSTQTLFSNNNETLILGAPINGITTLTSNTFKAQSFFGALSQIYIYNKALTYDQIFENYNIVRPRYNMPATVKLNADKDASLYIERSNITDPVVIDAVKAFVQGLKNNNLWDKLFVAYPFINSRINLKEPTLNSPALIETWVSSSQGLTPATSTTYGILPTLNYPTLATSSLHLSYLSYNSPTGEETTLIGTQKPLRGYGGNIYYSGSKTYHVYTTNTTASFTPIDPTLTSVDVLVVAGGGSGGSNRGGGGGAGGLILSSSYSITPGTPYTVVVGNGGQYNPTTSGPTINGTDSVFGSLIAFGGGGGGYGIDRGTDQPGANGGSGGGGGSERFGPPYITNLSGGLATPGQGFNGGAGTASYLPGGGGGSSQAGADGFDPTRPGHGGSGSYFAQYSGLGFGSPAGWFAGGGGGSEKPSGPGGAGTPSNITGVRNTGGGGAASTNIGGSGGSGIVIVSYDTNAIHYTGSTKLIHTETGLSGSIGNKIQGGVSGGGTIGFAVISRTNNNTLTLHKNNISSSLNIPVSGSIGGNLYLNAVNTNETASQFSPYQIAYASIGSGLTTSEVSTYYNLVSQLQTNLKRQNTLLDTYTGAAAAYSLRRIGPSGYFGPAIRVRRDSDNTLRDIGFTSDGQLDTVALLDFVGVTGSGFVNTWYDQSTRGSNATQATAASQPQVVLSGSVIVNQYNKITLRSDGASAMDLPTGAITGENVYSYAFVDKLGSTSQPVAFGTQHSSNPALIARLRNSSADAWVAARDNSGNQVEFFPFQPNFPRFIGTVALFTSGSTVGTKFSYSGSIGTYDTRTIPSYAGRNFTGSTFRLFYGVFYTGIMKMNEVIVYPSDPGGDTIITNMINTQAITGSDTDYQAFITATGITQPTQSAALETLVSDLKSYGLWTKMKAIYPMITDKYNLYSNTENLSTGWLTSNSTVTASNAAGPFTASLVANRLNDSISTPVTLTVTNNGASAYTIDGSDNPTLSLEKGRTYNFSISATGHPFYIMTGSGAYSADGQYNTGVTGQGTQIGTLTFTVPDNAPSTLAYVCQNHASMGGTINIIENTDQHYIYQTVALQSGSAYVMSTHARWNGRDYIVLNPDGNSKTWFDIRNGFVSSSQGTVATASITRVSGSASNPSGSWYRCAMVFTSSVSAPSNTSIQLATTDRVLTYGSLTGLSGSFLWGAQLEPGDFISPYLSNNTGNAFTTGSIFDQVKYNLKDPRNTNSAFRLTTGGTSTIGYAGFKGDGVSGYLDTNLAGSGVLIPGSTNLSVYVRSVVSDYQNLISSRFGARFTHLQTGPGTTSLRTSFGNFNIDTSTFSGRLGFALVSRTSINDLRIYRNNSLLLTNNNTTDASYNSTSFTINAQNSAGTIVGFSKHETSFATIGDGLSNYEAKALYWIVQKYQTTLGRQVY